MARLPSARTRPHCLALPSQSGERHRKARKSAQNLTRPLGVSLFLLNTRTSIQPSGLICMKARLGLTSARRFVWPPYWPITISRQILPVVNRTSDITKLSKMCFISGEHTCNRCCTLLDDALLWSYFMASCCLLWTRNTWLPVSAQKTAIVRVRVGVRDPLPLFLIYACVHLDAMNMEFVYITYAGNVTQKG